MGELETGEGMTKAEESPSDPSRMSTSRGAWTRDLVQEQNVQRMSQIRCMSPMTTMMYYDDL